MNKNDDITQNLLPTDRKFLLDEEAKVGQIRFTADEKRELSKITGTKAWDIIKGVYVKQRLVQIAVASVNASQTAEDLMFYKGKSAEANHLIKQIEMAVKEMKEEENAKNKPKS